MRLDVASIADCEVHALGIYGPEDHVGDDRVYVEVAAMKKPTVLVLTSYYATNWKVTLQKGADVRQVILSGHEAKDSLVDGIPEGIPVLRLEDREESFWAYSPHSRRWARRRKENSPTHPTADHDILGYV